MIDAKIGHPLDCPCSCCVPYSPPNALLPTEEVEAVAKAIAATHGWERDNALINWRQYEGEARAAITAMRADEGVVERAALLERTLRSVPIPGRTEPMNAFYRRMDVWLAGPYREAVDTKPVTPV